MSQPGAYPNSAPQQNIPNMQDPYGQMPQQSPNYPMSYGQMPVQQNQAIKKPFYKKPWFWIVIGVLLIAGYGMGDGSETTTPSTPTTTETTTPTTTETAEDTSTKIELIAGEQGEYGRELVVSEGTDLEERLIVYYLPSGDYSVTNIGDYPTQVTVYEGIRPSGDGYDEYTNTGDILMIKPQETGNLNVPEGWFIEIHEPTHIELTPKS
ncbi:MAG: hypothetical protein IKZ87_04085 [Actinomycetaceae bacterium]|nr:hypothetical protein [Actinomycetaceae bacterium]